MHGWPGVITPDFRVIGPVSDFLFPEEQQRGGYGEAKYPDDDEGCSGPASTEVGLHGKHDTEEAVTGDQGQGQDTRHQREYCKRNGHRQSALISVFLKPDTALLQGNQIYSPCYFSWRNTTHIKCYTLWTWCWYISTGNSPYPKAINTGVIWIHECCRHCGSR